MRAPNAVDRAAACDHPLAWRSGGSDAPLLREAFPAEDGTALRGAERDRSLLAALRASGLSLHAGIVMSIARRRRRVKHRYALGLAGFTTLGLVLELFVVEKQLLPGGEDEARAAVDAGEYLVLKFH